jgi:hypothetical protein
MTSDSWHQLGNRDLPGRPLVRQNWETDPEC